MKMEKLHLPKAQLCDIESFYETVVEINEAFKAKHNEPIIEPDAPEGPDD
jgi:hypothetical protein